MFAVDNPRSPTATAVTFMWLAWKERWWKHWVRVSSTVLCPDVLPCSSCEWCQPRNKEHLNNTWTSDVEELDQQLMVGKNSLFRVQWSTGTAAQRICGYPTPGGAQCQVGWGPGQPEFGEDSPAHSRGLELDDLQGPLQLKPFYDYDFMTTEKLWDKGRTVFLTDIKNNDYFISHALHNDSIFFFSKDLYNIFWEIKTSLSLMVLLRGILVPLWGTLKVKRVT